MKRTCLILLMVLTVALAALAQDASPQFKPRFMVIPMRGNTPAQALRESQQGQTVPLWTYQTSTTVDGNIYTGTIMGNAPGSPTASALTTIPVYLIPLIVVMPDGTRLDPTQPDPTCLNNNVPLTVMENSPLFQNSGPYMYGSPAVNLGTTQYHDALQRAEFWKIVGASAGGYAWHTLWGLHVTTPQTVQVPSDDGVTYNAGQNGGCGKLGVVFINWLDNYVTGTLIPSLANQGVGPTTFAMVFMYDVVEGVGFPLLNNCCVLGYHGAYGSPMQVYSPGELDSTQLFGTAAQDISVESHEMGEAMNDPTTNNLTPAWGHVGQVNGCKNNFEVGDPLTGTLNPPITLNGFTYHPQELAMYSWFLRPNVMMQPVPGVTGDTGVPTWYSTNGTFTSTQPVCQ